MSQYLKSTRFFLLLLLLGGFIILFCFFSKKGEITPVPFLESSGSGEDISIEGVRHFEFNGERLLWSIDAQEAKFFQPKSVVKFDNIKVAFYPSTGGEMLLTASKGYYETDTRNMGAEGGVMGISDEGYQFWTQNLVYDASTKEVKSENKVTLTKDRLTIEGVGLKGSLETRKIYLLSSVRATYSIR